MHFCSVGLNLVFVCLFFYFTFCSKKKKNFVNGFFWLMTKTMFLFFPLISTDVISETTELGLCLLIPCIFFYFSWEQLVLQDFEWCIMGRVITISDLKEVLKAKTEETEKNRKEARRDLIMGRATTLGTVLPNNSQSSTQTKKLQKTLPET